MSSSITGLSSNFGHESLAVAMTKKANEQQGQQALQLIQGAMETVQNTQAAAPKAAGSLGSNINIKV
ncbi:Uncharacterised protein [Anaerobiospirillum thomasii]|uniref:Motility protein n=1 Tax=Anaerobiospirillum thomasii TaxID=179995 RepID=A0A2X0WP02_9GAMM|nr:hypothetical protein [Anaerobiospirillum thomasii]SPT68262.1 Uncharacterised protein [Anaerobiospirillum thomasii]SPT70735.1 Uncharacterised protein [Anaerobiospirillum thomasii]